MIKLGNNDITLKVGSTDVSAAYLGSILIYTSMPPEPKWIATYAGGTTSSAQCDASSAITSGEVTTTGLVSVEIGSCVTTIGNKAFSGCSSLTSITIPDSVTSVDGYAFYGCSGLTSVTIPDSVTTVGSRVFSGCTSLLSVTIGSGVTSIGLGVFDGCTSLTSVTIPDSVTYIGNYAFSNCRSLSSITIPDSVTTIDEYAFFYCSGLTSVTVNATTPPSLGDYAFDSTNDCPIYVPAASVSAYQSDWSTYASRIQAIPEPSPQWVTFNSGDDISGLNVYGVKGVANNLSNTFAYDWENIYFELSRKIVYANIGDYSSRCYTDTYGFNDNVELIFGNIGCSDYYTLPASKTATSTFQLYIYQ